MVLRKQTDIVINAGSLMVSAMLLITFFSLMAMGAMDPSGMMTAMILIVIAVTCLAIYSSVYQIECEMKRKRK